ncbi:MAG: MFS transporter [Solirubrobacteraceae bacterium]
MHGHTNRRRAGSQRSLRTPGQGLLLAVLALAQLMVILDISAVNVALPDLAADLGIGRDALSWTITSYSLLFGSLLLLGGRAADLLGRRRVFLAGLGVFTAASLASALAGSAAAFFASRAGQGIGAAMLSPAALAIITASFEPGPERARALGVWGAVGGAGAAVGVLLGGLLTQLIDWRAIFLVNVPIGLAVAVAVRRVVPGDAGSPQWRRVDVPGAALATTGVGAMVFALSQASTSGWLSAQTLAVGAAGLAGVAAFVAYERRAVSPLLTVARLRDRAVGGGFVVMLAAAAVLFGSFLLSSLYLQDVLGTGALETGLAFVPFAVVTAGGVHLGTHVINHHGVRAPLAGGFALTAGGMFLLTGVSAGGSYFTDVLPGMLVSALGFGVVLVAVAFSVLSGAREEEAGMLSGLNTTGHELGGSLGLAILTAIATGSAGRHAGTVALTHGIANAFLAAAIIAAVAAVAAAVILPKATSFLPRLALARPASIH